MQKYTSATSFTLLFLLLLISCGKEGNPTNTNNNPTYEVTIGKTPNEGGEVNISPDGNTHEKGTEITLTPQPLEGYLFTEWTGDISSTDNPLTFTLNEDVSITGVFEKKTYPLNITIEGEGAVTEEIVKQKDYEHGTTVQLTANPSDGWEFNGWSGDISRTDNPTQLTVESELSVTANFAKTLKTFGGSGYEDGRSIVETTDGGYIITGRSWSNDGDFNGSNKGVSDIIILKVDSNYNQQWVKSFGGSGFDVGQSLIQTSDGGYIITGESISNDGDFSGLNKGDYDGFILKVDSNGNQQWIKSIGGSGEDFGRSLTQTSDGGYIITGLSDSNDGDFNGLNNGSLDGFILKVDSNGNQQWIKSVGGSGDDRGNSLTQTSDGEFLITGDFTSNDGDFNGLNKGSFDIFVLKVDSNGNQQWIKSVGGSGDDRGYSLIQISNEGYIITGMSDSNDGDFNGLNIGGADIFILKVDLNGNQQWIKSVGGSGREYGVSLTQTSDGGYIVTGPSDSNDGDFNGLNNGSFDIFILKVDSNGNQQWIKSVGGSGLEYGTSLTQTFDEGYIITGTSDSNDGDFNGLNKGDSDIFMIRDEN